MNRKLLFIAGIALPAALQAQPPEAGAAAAADDFSFLAATGGRLFFALIAGLLLAFAFQWILTALSAATGITLLGSSKRKEKRNYYREDRYRDEENYHGEESGEKGRWSRPGTSWERPAMKVEAGVGAWVIATSSISLFFAAWLAAELIRFGGAPEAVIMGLTVWAGFMLSMMWLESSMLGSLMGGLFGALKGGMQSVAAPLKDAAAGLAKSASGPLASSAEEIAAKVREEFRAQGGTGGLQERIREMAGKLPSRKFDRERVEKETEGVFEEPEIREAARHGDRIDRRRFQEIVASRADLAPEEQRIFVDTLHGRWNRLVEETRREGGSWSPAEAYSGSRGLEARGSEQTAEVGSLEARGSALAGQGAMGAGGAAAGSYQAGPYSAPVQGSAGPGGASAGSRTAASAPAFSARLQAFKEFLRNSDKRDLNPVRIEQEVERIVIHPEEGYATMVRSVRDMNREELAQVLRQRRDITLQESDSIADLIDAARTRMLSRSEMREHRTQETEDKALARIRDAVYSIKRPEMDLEGFRGSLSKLLEDPQAGFQSLKEKVPGLDRDSLVQAFSSQSGMSRQDAERLADQAGQAMERAREQAARVEEETRRRMEALRREAQEQAESARKVAASAAWWLFAASVVSAIVAVLGGLTGAAT
jgi:hypothetical protein